MSKTTLESLEADIEMLTLAVMDGLDGCDFEVKYEPKPRPGEAFVSHVGKRVSSITDVPYLFKLANFNDWSASKDDEKAAAAAGEEQKKHWKNARYSRKRAAYCRLQARRVMAGSRGGSNEGSPF